MNALTQPKVQIMARAYKPRVRLDQLDFSPSNNPLAELATVKTKDRFVRTGRAETYANTETGEIKAISIMHEVNKVDNEHFIKIFSAGAVAMFELSRTARKVFDLVLRRYQASEMTGGYADTVELFWFKEGLDGKSIGITEQTFNTGLRELIDKQFLYPRITHSYWVNPNLFFKGDRVMFIKEYVRQSKQNRPATKKATDQARIEERDPNTIDFINGVTDAELIARSES